MEQTSDKDLYDRNDKCQNDLLYLYLQVENFQSFIFEAFLYKLNLKIVYRN